MNTDYSHNCRVCGLEQETQPWSGDRGQVPSFHICSCCGVEFGVEDEGIAAVVQYRKQWLESCLEWFNPEERPKYWDVDNQLSQIPPAYGFSPVIKSEKTFRDLYETGRLELLNRARISPEIWKTMLNEDFETFGPLAAEASFLLEEVEEMLLDSEHKEVLERLSERGDLDLRKKAQQHIDEVLSS